MGFEKISKEAWLKLSKEEQEHLSLEFKKSVEKRIRSTVIVTRIIAILLVVALFFIGFVQLNAVKEYGQIKDKYGKNAFCYLCGLENYRKCECQYISSQGVNKDVLKQLDNLSISLAEYNIKDCGGMKVQDGSYQYAQIIPNISLEDLE